MSRDHGGDLGLAIAQYGGDAAGWIDLSTGINRQPYPILILEPRLWQDLPRAGDLDQLCNAAADAYGVERPMILPVAGAQAAIQLYPRLGLPGIARVLGPTYNEHAGSLSAQGWQVEVVTDPAELAQADLAVIVSPNNPDGRIWTPQQIAALSKTVGKLVVDESFADPTPHLSVANLAGQGGLIVLRSFGKFYGLAGLRLGFVLAGSQDIAQLAALSGPWAVSGPACAIGAAALRDQEWQMATTDRLNGEMLRMDDLAARVGWAVVGGTALFRTYAAPDAAAAQAMLARQHIWSRIFPYSAQWIRLGLPGTPDEWARLSAALAG